MVHNSEILSNIDQSPFVISSSNIEQSTSILIISCSHESKWTNLLPLVDLANRHQNTDGDDTSTETIAGEASKPRVGTFGDDEIRVIGCSLDFHNIHFPIGSGPLFSFGMQKDRSLLPNLADIRMKTMLSSSSLLNVTSPGNLICENQNMFGSLMEQEIVGCCVSGCSNHDSGTTMLDVHFGGNLHSVNTSFSSCVRETNTPVSSPNANYTQGQRIVFGDLSSITSATFTLCTFTEMRGSYGDHTGGSAILITSPASLTIAQCSFHVCNVSGYNDDGGAVFFWHKQPSTNAMHVAQSSFTECKAIGGTSNFGGSVFARNTTTVSIADSFFEKTEAQYGSAVAVYEKAESTLTNCSFVGCWAPDSGTLQFYNETVSVSSLTYLLFRECSAGQVEASRDIFFQALPFSDIESKIRYCDSTSGAPSVYFVVTDTSDSTLVPQITSTPTVEACTVTFSGNDALVEIRTKEVIGGVMGVLLEGCLVPRLVFVEFDGNGENSTTGRATVSSGADGILPSAEYTLRSFVLPGDLGFQVFSASAILKDVNTTTITLKGASLDEGSYWMCVQEGSNTMNISLSRTDSTTLVGEAPLYPASAEGRLDWATEYEVLLVHHSKDGVERPVQRANRITFITPDAPARIDSFLSHCLNGRKTEVTLILGGISLPTGSGWMIAEGSDSSVLVEGVVSVSEATRCSGVFSVGWEENTTHLCFEKTYWMKSASSGSDEIAIDCGVSFVVPSPPVITCFSLPTEYSSDSFPISVVGSNFPSAETYTVSLSSFQSFEVSFVDGTTGTGTIKAGLPSEIQFNTTYSIESVSKGEEHVLLNQTGLKTPLGPTLETVTTVLNASNKNNVIFTLTGSRMMTGTHTLTFIEEGFSTPTSISVSIDSMTVGSGEVVVFGGSQLKYGTSYSISLLTSHTLHFALDGSLTFETPNEPARVVGIWGSLDASGNTTSITLRGRQMEKGSYIVKLNSESGPSFEVSFADELSEERNSSAASVAIFGPSAILSYATPYSLFSITRTDSPEDGLLINANPSAFRIDEPTRVASTFPVLSIDSQTVTVSLSGYAFTLDSFTAQLQITSPTPSTPFTATATRLSNKELEITLRIQSGTPRIEFGDEITLLSIMNSSTEAILDCATFLIPHPPIVTSAECDFANTLNTSIRIELTGTDLPLHTQFLVKLDSGDTFTISFATILKGSTAEMGIGWPDTLQYSRTYRIALIQNELTGQTVFVGDSVLFSTDPPPSPIMVFCDSSSSDSSRLCGSIDRPCSSMDLAWKVGAMTGSLDVSIRIKLSATLSNSVSCVAGGIVVVETGTSIDPLLRVPLSAQMGEKGMIVVSSDGLFELRAVDVLIESTLPSFVFLFASNSTVVIVDGSFIGHSDSCDATHNTNDGDDSSVCSWETGLIELDNCETRVDNTTLSNLAQGGMNMKNGSLTIETTRFSGNSPRPDLSSSSRRNIHCSEDGHVIVGSLNGGDGTPANPSPWISASDCRLTGLASVVASPLFVPSLKSESKSALNKKSKMFSLDIHGSCLFDCDLKLEVFEVEKTRGEGNCISIDLTNASTTSFSESRITLSLLESQDLEESLEWRGRLMYGNGVRTKESFVIQSNTADRMTESVLESMKWWIPLVVGVVCLGLLLIVLIICCGCRSKDKAEDEEQMSTNNAEMDASERDKMAMAEEWDGDLPQSSIVVAGETELRTDKKEDTYWKHPCDDTDEAFDGVAERKGDEMENEMKRESEEDGKDERKEMEEMMERPHKKKRKKKTEKDVGEGENEEATTTVTSRRTEEEDGVEEQKDGSVEGKKRKRKKMAKEVEEEDKNEEGTMTSHGTKEDDGVEEQKSGNEEGKMKRKKKKDTGVEEANDNLLIVEGQNNDTVNEVDMTKGKEGEEDEGESEVKKRKKKKKKKQEEIVEGESVPAEAGAEIEESTMNEELNTNEDAIIADEGERPKRKKKKKKVGLDTEEELKLREEVEIVEMGGDEAHKEEDEGKRKKKKGRKKRTIESEVKIAEEERKKEEEGRI
ncbi:hypothetical protein BLNAU_20571 [Blattamonas nauphoetae]|uniref:Uncharacterized protein n=1 Tax=Blattamonas nauphoetae TaxID=2049346 RepID=A0ABQ9WYD7_9EUKA|nr:hypothetical protein BLNAU_20571 [Blattamonas nauphoetae]